ncbi:tRNA pseudouridine(55) synthase TruB [uncultured Tyzzerella sp.]|uniref:tRNA pseudouridine(55) synthase TruB n=1 Tax=uncultured Tyzzerella sp. TaxID=2321398 RepID=UPI002942253A|nr:tRNA pseudouridine(55) synthase TruB [uncultured Tyzzerella sp.]
MENISGVINIYKEKGFTSHDVVNIVRKKLGRIKTGHTGTLDPDAMGVLPICVGKATKLSEYIASSIKEYKAIVVLGKKTTTQDSSGEVIEEKPVMCSKEEIKNLVSSFKGDIMQIPPMYSAIKVGGKKLYELAREGKEIERKQRKITIYNIEITKFIDSKSFEITVLCSKGTYIRTLCNDIGDALGCGAYMSYLLRTRTGKFYIDNAIKLEDIDGILQANRLNDILIPMDKVLLDYKKVVVLDRANKFLYNGNKISFNYLKDRENLQQDEKVIVYDENNNLIGIYIVLTDCIKPLTMLL